MFKDYFIDFENFMYNADVFGVEPTPLDYFYFQRLFREFANWKIAYDTPHDFYGAFFNIWEDAVFEISKKKEIVEILASLEQIDYTKDYTISTYAQNPNETPRAPQELINFYNTQNYSESNMKKVEAYARAYQLVPRGIIIEFIKRFEKLFLACINDNTMFFKN